MHEDEGFPDQVICTSGAATTDLNEWVDEVDALVTTAENVETTPELAKQVL